MNNPLIAGADFSQEHLDMCLMDRQGQVILIPQDIFTNNYPGYLALRDLLVNTIRQYDFDGLWFAGEATGFLWWHTFYHLAHDPELAAFDPQLLLLNPKWVKWFKKTFPEEEKVDFKDAFFVTERARQHPPKFPYRFDEPYLALRFYTRHYLHLTRALASEKTYFLSFLVLKASEYGRLEPFSDVFGKTSSHILSTYPALDQVATIPTATLAQMLQEVARNHLPDPLDNAAKLQRVARESYPLAQAFVEPVHTLLSMTLDHIRFLEGQIAQVVAIIEALAPQFPGIAILDSIPGIGLILAACLVAEIGDVKRFMVGQKYDRKKKRFRSKTVADGAASLAKFVGLWWPRSSSGKFEGEDRRLAQAGNRYGRYTYIQAAFCLKEHNAEYRAYYDRKYRQSSKHKHKRALVLTGRKAVNLTFGLLHRGEMWRPPEERMV
ncbi:MAG: transposase [Anaerolineae bacterium]